MDWIIDKLTGDLGDEKVVLFINLKNSVRAMQYRLREEKIGFVTVWGEENDKRKRFEAQERFWRDPECRVLIGTKAIEQSLNLQVARHLINLDIILNPSRMQQLAGRIRRDGSQYSHVFVHNLLTVNTQEARYMPMLEREQALADFIWDENNQLFNALDPIALLHLISG
jgi:SNF2 family DNA or RNA helicase